MSRSELTPQRGNWNQWHDESTPLTIGVSACLLGQEVRHDAGHARDRFLTDTLALWVEWRPVCPEMESGMGVPRPTVRLVDEGEGLKMVAPSTGEDFTDRMNGFAAKRIVELNAEGIDGYVLKKNSPSCGMERLRVYRGKGVYHKRGSGLFAAALAERLPGLPIEEEGRLNDPRLRENFIERAFCRNRWRVFARQGFRRGRLVEFHTAHKLILRAHDEKGYQALGRLVAGEGGFKGKALFGEYERLFQETLEKKPTRRKHTNVLQHAQGYLKKVLAPEEKREVSTAVEDFRRGLTPLIVPLTLLGYLVRRHEIDYLQGQLYFDPHPKELMLRNHV